MPRYFSDIPTFFAILIPLLTTVSSQQCRSYNRQPGNCVSIKLCPPLLDILKNKPSGVQLRHLQKLTCGFEDGDPKVCCPIRIIASSSTGEIFQEALTDEEPTLRIPSNPTLKSHPAFNKLPVLKECGLGIGDNRIIGGKNVSFGNYPWMARIGYKTGPNSKKVDYYCGGTIIGKRWILTAAHCTDGVEDDYAPVEVRLGEHDTGTAVDCNTDLEQCSSAEDYTIAKLIPHEEYSSNTKQNDISLILLDKDIIFDKFFIRPICLPFEKEYELPSVQEGKGKGIVAGWGRTLWNKATGSKILQQVTVPLKTNEECQTVYSRRVTISSNQLCAGGEAGQDSCGGDSGGPLMYAISVQKVLRFFQLGIVSYGPVQCGIGGLPGVYSRTSAHLKWILDKIQENELNL